MLALISIPRFRPMIVGASLLVLLCTTAVLHASFFLPGLDGLLFEAGSLSLLQ